nr:hypothetical protein [Escherichia coli]
MDRKTIFSVAALRDCLGQSLCCEELVSDNDGFIQKNIALKTQTE